MTRATSYSDYHRRDTRHAAPSIKAMPPLKMCCDMHAIIAPFLSGYQQALDIHAAPNEIQFSFETARSLVNTPKRTDTWSGVRKYNNSLRIPFRDTFQYRGIKPHSSKLTSPSFISTYRRYLNHFLLFPLLRPRFFRRGSLSSAVYLLSAR